MKKINKTKYICKFCNITFYRWKCKKPKYCSKKCQYAARKGISYSPKTEFKKGDTYREKSPVWKGGRKVTKDGYVYIATPGHPHPVQREYVAEHRLVMEKHIGRYLTKDEVVHHIDKNPSNNKIENLMLFPSIGAHTSFHFKYKHK